MNAGDKLVHHQVRPGTSRPRLALAGRKAQARRILLELQAEADRTAFHHPHVATVLLALDDIDGALKWLERSEREANPKLRARALAVLKAPPVRPPSAPLTLPRSAAADRVAP